MPDVSMWLGQFEALLVKNFLACAGRRLSARVPFAAPRWEVGHIPQGASAFCVLALGTTATPGSAQVLGRRKLTVCAFLLAPSLFILLLGAINGSTLNTLNISPLVPADLRCTPYVAPPGEGRVRRPFWRGMGVAGDGEEEIGGQLIQGV